MENQEIAPSQPIHHAQLLDLAFMVAVFLRWAATGGEEFTRFFGIKKHPSDEGFRLTKEDLIKVLKIQGREIDDELLTKIISSISRHSFINTLVDKNKEGEITRESYWWRKWEND